MAFNPPLGHVRPPLKGMSPVTATETTTDAVATELTWSDGIEWLSTLTHKEK